MTFIVAPTQRAVLLPRPTNPGQILSTIHSARELEWQGHRILTVPFKVWEAQALRARGINVPSPIGYYYDWPRDRVLVPEPFQNQCETSGALTLWHRGYCLNEIGTGKTLSAMWAADYLMDVGMIRRAFILSPLSTIQRVWGDACFAHFRDRTVAILHGTAAKRRKLLAQNHDFYVINHEALDIVCDVVKKTFYADAPEHVRPAVEAAGGLHTVAGADAYTLLMSFAPPKDRHPYRRVIPIGERVVSAQLMRDDIDLFIVDELGNYRGHKTAKWRVLKKLIGDRTWVWGLTGTPCPNAPYDAWAQCNLITPHTVPDSFTTFKNMTMEKLTEHISIPLPNAMDIVYRVMQPAIRFERDQCYDLPPCTYSTREVKLTDEQKKHYKEIAKDLYTEIDGGKVSAVNEGVKAGKLVQIACGVVLDNERNARLLDCKPRVELVKELIEEAGHKVIIFVPYRAPLVMLAAELEKHWTVAQIHGDVSPTRRNTIFAQFQAERDPRILVADAGTMSHGLTLTEASTIIWYGPEWSNDTYTQANGRITRAGQRNQQHIIHIASTEIERRIYKRLEERGRLQGLLLEMVKRGEAL